MNEPTHLAYLHMKDQQLYSKGGLAPHRVPKGSKQPPFGGNPFRTPASAISFSQSLLKPHNHRLGLQCRSTDKLRVLPFGISTSSTRQTGTATATLQSHTVWSVNPVLHFPLTCE